jgi:hypothetical protein
MEERFDDLDEAKHDAASEAALATGLDFDDYD